MPKGYLPSEKDRDTLRELIRWWKTRQVNSPRGGAGLDEGSPPEVHIAWVGASGIPALSEGGDLGTGTGSAITDDVPGSAVCYLYRILQRTAGPQILSIPGTFRTVYNLGSSAVSAFTWVPVVREKFGAWLVAGGAAGSGATAFSGAMVRRSTDGSNLVAGDITPITFDTEVLDDGGYWSAGSPTRFTIPSSGLHVVGGTIAYSGVSGLPASYEPRELVANILLNGVTTSRFARVWRTQARGSHGASGGTTYQIAMIQTRSGPTAFVAGDYLELATFYTGGAPGVTFVFGGEYTRFWIHRLPDQRA